MSRHNDNLEESSSKNQLPQAAQIYDLDVVAMAEGLSDCLREFLHTGQRELLKKTGNEVLISSVRIAEQYRWSAKNPTYSVLTEEEQKLLRSKISMGSQDEKGWISSGKRLISVGPNQLLCFALPLKGREPAKIILGQDTT